MHTLLITLAVFAGLFVLVCVSGWRCHTLRPDFFILTVTRFHRSRFAPSCRGFWTELIVMLLMISHLVLVSKTHDLRRFVSELHS